MLGSNFPTARFYLSINTEFPICIFHAPGLAVCRLELVVDVVVCGIVLLGLLKVWNSGNGFTFLEERLPELILGLGMSQMRIRKLLEYFDRLILMRVLQ